jgi:hypothetical protein
MRGLLVSVIGIAFALQTAASAGAQQPASSGAERPNFSGTWKLMKQDPPTTGRGGGRGGGDDRGALRALEATPVTVKIAQNGNDLTFESTMSDGWVRTLQFKLDFVMTENPLPPGGDGGEPRLNGPTKTRGRWMGNKLFLHQTQGLGQRRDVLSLNGGVLTIQRDYETPGGSGTLYLTFNKVS